MELNKKEDYSYKIFKNTVWNLAGGAITLIIQFLSVPYIVKKLGEDAYGIWSLAWVLLSYLGFLSLGLGVASVKYISEYYGKRKFEECNKIFWTSLLTTGLQGLFAAIIFIGFAPLIVKKFFNIRADLIADSIIVVKLCGIALLMDFLLGTVQSVHSALQRLDIVNKVGLGINSTQIIGIVFILMLGGRLLSIVIFSLFIQIFGVLIYYIVGQRLLINRKYIQWDKGTFWLLLKFGGFVSISAIVAPILTNVEKLLISNILSVGFLTYYIVPHNLLTRFYLISASLTSALFPAMSEMSGQEDKSYLYATIFQGIRILSAAIGWASTLLFVFAKEFLIVWMGAAFAQQASSVLQILSIAFWINIIAHIPFIFLRAYGKPHLPAIYHLIESIFYIPIAYFLIKSMGISGAAIAWGIRVLIDTILLCYSTIKILKSSAIEMIKAIFNINLIFALLSGLLIAFMKEFFNLPLIFLLCLTIILCMLGAYNFWLRILRVGEKKLILDFLYKIKASLCIGMMRKYDKN